MAKDPSTIPPEKIALYQKLLATDDRLEMKGKKFRYTSLNGHMFTYLDPTGTLGIRMSKEDQKAFGEQYGSEPFIQYNSVMRDYVKVPAGLFEDTETLAPWLQKSYEHIASLKPKPTTKKKN
ncbi:MAG TPA: hypothetical protein DCE41_08845 [Cytophagales bacterium]|nr:hypothetical protein [Cytophagales bacterium]HAA17231.1 hypothetical protein [Cytophagales bacterium]HAP63094.1 hypothetical protein [Cytophagales bacterium]